MFRGLSTLLAGLVTALALAACGGDDGDSPDTTGGLSASELASKLPEGGTPQAVAVDVSAAKEAAGLPEDTDPAALGANPEETRLASSAYFALFSLSAAVENPVRTAMDNSQVTAYAAHPDYASEASVALVSTTQEFDEIASALEDEGWERDGDVLTGESDEGGLTYDTVGAADGFLVLGYSAESVEAVTSGDAEPSDTGEVQALEDLDAPVVGAVIPEVEGFECVTLITFEDFVDGKSTIYMTVDGRASAESISKQLAKDSASAGFTVASEEAEGETVTIELEGRDDEGLANSPALLIAAGLDGSGPLLYDCG